MSYFLRAVLSFFFLVIAVASASAQTPEPVDDSGAMFGSLPGIESGVVRVFSGESAGTAASASPIAATGVTGVTTAILTFDTEANARAGMTKIQTDAQGESSAIALLVGDLGDRKAAFILEDAEGTITGSVIVSQTGTELIVVLVDGADDAVEALAIDVVTSIVETPAGSGEANVVADGTSTGGAWDRLPTADSIGLSTAEDIAI